MKATILAALAPMFNRLLDIQPGHFKTAAASPKTGAERAKVRLAAHRVQQAERLKDWPPLKKTRQQKRAEGRKWTKRILPTATQRAALEISGRLPKSSKGGFVNYGSVR